MNVDDVVAEKIAAARARIEVNKRRRAALAASRQRGLAHRHAAKLRNRANRGDTPTTADVQVTDSTVVADPPQSPGRVDMSTTADDAVTELTETESRLAVQAALARLGLTYAELKDQARRRNFTSAQANSLWMLIGGANPNLLGAQEETTEENR